MIKKKSIHKLIFIFLFIPGIILFLFKIFGPFDVNPTLFFSSLLSDDSLWLFDRYVPHWYSRPTIESSVSNSTFVGAYLATKYIFDGSFPFWNYYSGLGTPLLADFPSAAYFPFAWLMYFGNVGHLLFHYVLPLIGGLGFYLFCRKLNLSKYSSLFAGLSFQFIGIFPWLQNAIFNPISFFPLLLLCIEAIYIELLTNKQFHKNLYFGKYELLFILFSSLSVLSGFPEITYLYTFPLIGWLVYRCTKLKKNLIIFFIKKLFILSLVSLIICSPVLVSFFDFLLYEGHPGAHQGEGYSGHHRNLVTLITYLFPYFFGSIFGYPTTELWRMWGGIGGYSGFLVFLFSIISLFIKPTKLKKSIFLIAIIVILIEFGFPLISDIFYLFPVNKLIAASRYLNIIWVSILLLLTSLFINDLSKLNKSDYYISVKLIKKLLIAIFLLTLAVIVLIATYYFFNYSFEKIFKKSLIWYHLISILFPLILVFFSYYLIIKKNFLCLTIVLFSELFFLSFFPLSSYPLNAKYDFEMVNFLKSNINQYRVVDIPGQSSPIAVNLGAIFGISQLNYVHVVSPYKTYEYLKTNVDKDTNPVIFLPDFPAATLNSYSRKINFFNKINEYEKLGVKYILQKKEDAKYLHINPQVNTNNLNIKENTNLVYQYKLKDFSNLLINSLDLFILNNLKNAGKIEIKLCNKFNSCSISSLHLDEIKNNKFNSFKFKTPLVLTDFLSLNIKSFDLKEDTLILLSKFDNELILPVIRLSYEVPHSLVYEDNKFEVFELDNPSPYYEAENCKIEFISKSELISNCLRNSKLLRREVYSKNWKVLINDKSYEVAEYDNIFQQITVPKGISKIKFIYNIDFFDLRLLTYLSILTTLLICYRLLNIIFLKKNNR